MMTDELKPCPFCGEGPVFANVPNAPEIYCEDCGCASISDGTQEEVYRLWNARTDIHEAEVKRLREALSAARDSMDKARCLIKFHTKPQNCVEMGENIHSGLDIYSGIVHSLAAIDAALER